MGMMNQIIYVSVPYTSPYSAVTDYRMLKFAEYAGELQRNGYTVVSALYNHFLLEQGIDLPSAWEFWKTTSETLVVISDEVHVLQLDDWDKSIGVKGEIDFANSLGIKVVYIEPDIY